MELTLNRSFARRHLGVAALLFALGCWFGYDGFVAYPARDAEELFAAVHGGKAAPSREVAERFKEKAVPRQIEFMSLAFAASFVIALHVLLIARRRFSYDEHGFTANGRRHAWSEVAEADVDRRAWAKKGIVRFRLGAERFTLDAWHHEGVEFCERHLP